MSINKCCNCKYWVPVEPMWSIPVLCDEHFERFGLRNSRCESFDEFRETCASGQCRYNAPVVGDTPFPLMSRNSWCSRFDMVDRVVVSAD